ANQPIPGVLHERLPGLRPGDAEALLRACGVRGDSPLMQDYLQRHCDCHPLVTGVVAGLINDYLPARGDFDRWAADPNHGADWTSPPFTSPTSATHSSRRPWTRSLMPADDYCRR